MKGSTCHEQIQEVLSEGGKSEVMINNKSVKEELYSENQLHIHTIDSLITHDRVFVGNQTDDFAVAKVLQNSQRILLLGVGYGGALRPLLIGNSSVEITAVDLNPRSIKN